MIGLFIDEVEIRKAINAIKGDDRIFEIRIISQREKFPISGYFKSADKAVECLKEQKLEGTNVYIVLNAIDEACYSRLQRDKFILAKTASTSDNDIVAREWILVDIDPVRPKDTSSTQEQLDKALEKCGKVHNFLLEQGFPRPIIGFSGNGYHLLYRLKLQNNKDNTELLKKFLATLDELFSDDEMHIDKVNFNASRVCKLYGTMAQKGLNTAERPHRMSKIIKIPDEIKPVDVIYLKRICNLVQPEQITPNRYNNYSTEQFDIEEWMNKYGLSYKAYSYGDGTKYCLEHCPFDYNHTGKDSAIFKRNNGAIAFKCLHNSCADKTWRDVRMMFEPTAYEKRQKSIEKNVYQSYKREEPKEPVHIVQKDENEPIFFTAKNILSMGNPTEQIIKSGIIAFDKKFRGFRKNDVTILSGQTGSAKSTLLSQIILNAIDAGNNVATFSGELAEKDYMRWMNRQCAGRSYVTSTQWEGYYDVEYKYQVAIADWVEGHFWLYNNKYGFNFEAILEQFNAMVDRHNLDMLCVDNLMALDITGLSKEKYDAQSQFAWRLHEFAQQKHIHIIIVCHPRKPTGLLGMYDISGTSDIVNACDNIIYVYRNNQLFKNSYKQFFGFDYAGTGTNIWHCPKARFGSVDDSYNDLFYEQETLRLKNDVDEVKNYGWIELYNSKKPTQEALKLDDGFREMKDGEDLPWHD